jgi:hypothetical protein
MSLTTIKEPQALSFSRNPVWYRFLSNNYLTTVGTKAKYNLTFDSIYVGVQFDLIFNGKTFTLEFVTTPDGTGYQLRSFSSSLSQFNECIANLKQLYELNKYYTITFVSHDVPSTTGVVQLEAKQPGTIWNLAVDNVTYGVSIIQLTAGTDNVYNPNYKVFADLHHQTDPSVAPAENQIAQLDADAHQDDIVIALAANEFVFDFELQNLIHSLVSPHVPDWNETDVVHAASMMIHFWLRYGEIYGEDPKVWWNDYNGAANVYKKVIIGGLPLDEVTLTVLPDYTTTKLLNRQPAVKCVSKSCQEYIYKYVSAAQTDLQLHGTITYTDGTAWTGVIGNKVNSSVQQRVYVFPAGWDALNLGSKQPSKTPVKYAVYVRNAANTVLSETQTYVLDLTDYESETHLLFLGACGAMETVWCNGYIKESLQSESEPVVAAKAPWYDRGTAILKHSNSTQNTKYTLNTGFKDLEYIQWLRELANSDFVLMAENGYWTSVRVDKKSFKELPSAMDDLYALTFDVERIIHY